MKDKPISPALAAALDAVAKIEAAKIPAQNPAATGHCSAGGEDGAETAPKNRASRSPDEAKEEKGTHPAAKI